MEQRTKDSTDLRAKIDRYLDASGLARRGPKIVPPLATPDRRYFRVLLTTATRWCWRCARPIDFHAPFANVAELLPGAAAGAEILGPRTTTG
jgi:hypothetical protein